jgi:hypothetical protein
MVFALERILSSSFYWVILPEQQIAGTSCDFGDIMAKKQQVIFYSDLSPIELIHLMSPVPFSGLAVSHPTIGFCGSLSATTVQDIPHIIRRSICRYMGR